MTKQCQACGEEKPLDQFGKDKSRTDGTRGCCRACKSAADKAWYAENREKVLDALRARHTANPEVAREAARVRYHTGLEQRQKRGADRRGVTNANATKHCPGCCETKPIEAYGKNLARQDGLSRTCKACCLAKTRAWRLANPEKSREAVRAWQSANPEKVRERNRTWQSAHPEKVREANRAYREANLEKSREAVRAWRLANPEKVREARQAKAAHLRDAKRGDVA